jgi:hypothetical protein
MWVRFLADFDWKPKPAVTVGYATGHIANVTRTCAAKAIAAGKAEKTEAPK